MSLDEICCDILCSDAKPVIGELFLSLAVLRNWWPRMVMDAGPRKCD